MLARAPKTPSADSEAVLRSLADPTRRRLLQLLLREELNVGELVEALSQPQSTISRHLKTLRTAGLVQDRRNGTTVRYIAVDPTEDGDELSCALVRWIRQQPLPTALQGRLERVLRKRHDDAVGFFERLGNRWDELRSEAYGDAFPLEAFITLLPSEWTVADLGAGTGFLLPALAGHFRRVLAVEPSPTMLECARRRITERGFGNVSFHAGDLGRLPIRGCTCHLAVACLVLHHVPEPDTALVEMHRILHRGGRLLIIEQQAHDNQVFREMMQDRWWGFLPAALMRKAQEAGFRAVRHQEITMTRRSAGTLEVPPLFVITGEKSA